MRLTEADLKGRIYKFVEEYGEPPKKIHLTHEQRADLFLDLSFRSPYRMPIKENEPERYDGIEVVVSDSFALKA